MTTLRLGPFGAVQRALRRPVSRQQVEHRRSSQAEQHQAPVQRGAKPLHQAQRLKQRPDGGETETRHHRSPRR